MTPARRAPVLSVWGAIAAGPLLSSRGDLVRFEIGSERLGVALTIHHGHVTVGPHEINGIAPQTAPAHIALPTENVQRQPSLFTYCPDLRPGGAINAHLPVQRGQRREVVVVVPTRTRLHPWQAIATVQPSHASFAQRASAVVHRRLRDRAKHQAPGRSA